MIHKIHHLHCGTMCPACAPLVSQKGIQAHFICHCLLLETDRGLVLIDTGLGLQDYLHTRQRLGALMYRLGKIEINHNLTAFQQIQQLGLNPKDVQHIFVSHLDFDHAGGISDFPQATVHVLASEFNATQALSFKNRIRYKTDQFKNHRFWNFIEDKQGENWFNLEKVSGLPLFQDEILMIPLLGHSAGHSGIAIKQGQSWVLFCGDAYFSHLELDPKQKLKGLHLFESMLAYDNKMRLNNLKQLQHLAQHQPQIELICAHDIQEFLRYRPLS
ncbi:MBL fold metallo-hydrolase [Acinetobacter guerrae]|uniref:MBL fold metallo-hydrolase n=1 Tax=Acinetobacter guerrae TaxID=1843371 RepID=A0A3A8F0W7_9GAMM|nr:MBL fold metallo-hydrolase [Acinetobacter guerrae]RKG34353.1 MBL fold metallo-hydrolase [Acinetobacter guerrae]